MGSTIEFSRTVLVSDGVGRFEEPFYMGVAETGCSNLFDQEGRIARSYDMLQIAKGNQFMTKVVCISQDCEGGMLKMNGRWCKPESYIAAWRKAKNNALHIKHYLKYANIVIKFNSMIEYLEHYKTTLDLSRHYHRKLLIEVNDLIIDLYFTDGIEEKTFTWFSEEVNKTEFTITSENWKPLLEKIEKVQGFGFQPQSIFQFNPSQYAMERGRQDQNREISDAAA